MTDQPPHPTISTTVRAAFSRVGRTLAHTSPVRLLLLICVTIAATHSFTMFSLNAWHTLLPGWAHSLIESALLVLVLFPALYFFSFRPLFAQIAEREQAEKTMWMSEHKYRRLFNSLGDAAFLVDVETGRIIDANEQAERLLARRRPEIVGASQDILFPSEKVEEFALQLRRRSEDEIGSFEAEVQTADGRRVPVHGSASPLSLMGRDLVVALFRDITEFKTLHAELLHAQRLESVGALASGIAHDLNNALAPILIATDLLRGQPKGAGNPRLLDAVGSSAARASQIVRQMLTFVRGGDDRRTDVPLRHLVREAADMARVAFPKAIQIHENLPNDLWPVKADATQLSQVLMNLAVNARDAMPNGGELSFSAENTAVTETGQHGALGLKPGSYVALSVDDTGCGIPPEIKERIFDPFFTTKPAGKGTGLGLATSRDIVSNHGGFIQVDTAPGQGSKFRIFLPANAEARVAPVAPVSESTPKGHGELVLIADDEAFILEMTRLALEAAGYRVLQARDGTEAVALGAEHKCDLQVAIIDLMMPFLDGAATVRALHKINPSLRIVRMSGVVDSAENVETDGFRGEAFLQKPFSGAQLLEAVDEAFRA